jgi:predicted  nucleic acid-binding Zn-ribbon protein
MPDPADGDLEARVRDLEHEVLRLKDGVEISRADASAARVLVGGADRDVSDMQTLLRAHTQTLNALRETQLEQQSEIRELRSEMHSEIRALHSEMQQGFGMLHTGMAQIVASLPNRRHEDDQPE